MKEKKRLAIRYELKDHQIDVFTWNKTAIIHYRTQVK